MARLVLLANDGKDRLVIRTICTHLIFFHEAGYEFRSQRRQGKRWLSSDQAEQPSDFVCTFNDGIAAETFGATPQSGVGFYKLTCETLSIRRHCVWAVEGSPKADLAAIAAAGEQARLVNEVTVHFRYAGRPHVLQHSTGLRKDLAAPGPWSWIRRRP